MPQELGWVPHWQPVFMYVADLTHVSFLFYNFYISSFYTPIPVTSPFYPLFPPSIHATLHLLLREDKASRGKSKKSVTSLEAGLRISHYT